MILRGPLSPNMSQGGWGCCRDTYCIERVKKNFVLQRCIWMKAHLPLRDRNPNTYNFDPGMTLTLEWAWPWDDLGHINTISLSWQKNLASNSPKHFTKVTLTLIFGLDIDMVQMFHHTKNEVSVFKSIQKLWPEQTDTQRVRKHYLPACAGGKINLNDNYSIIINVLDYTPNWSTCLWRKSRL